MKFTMYFSNDTNGIKLEGRTRNTFRMTPTGRVSVSVTENSHSLDNCKFMNQVRELKLDLDDCHLTELLPLIENYLQFGHIGGRIEERIR